MSLPPTFANDLANIALDQHAKFSGLAEDNPKLCHQIKLYWTNLGFSFTSCTTVPWAAVFVCWCVNQAGATSSQFKFAENHSEFVHEAINNALSDTGEFRAFEITKHAPKVGDIIQNNRGGTSHDYDFASKHAAYASHTAIVVEVGVDPTSGDKFARTIGGNEGDSIRSKIVELDSAGLIKQRALNPFICVVTNV